MTDITDSPRPQRGIKSLLMRAAAGSLGMRIAQAFLGIGVSILLARMLGVEGVGTYAAVVAAFQIALIPIQAGLGTFLGRQVVRLSIHKAWSEIRSVIIWSTKMAMLYALALSIFAALVRPHSDVLRQLPIVLIVGGVVAMGLGRLAASYHRGLKQILIGQSFDLIRNVLLLLGVASASFFAVQIGAAHAFGIFVISGAISATLLIIWAMKTTPQSILAAEATVPAKSEWLRTSATFMMITGGMQAADLIGIVLTRALAGPAQAGLFQSSYQLSTLILFGLGAITMAIGPYFTQFHETQDQAKLARLARLSAQASTAFAAVFGVIILLLGKDLMIYLFGEDFGAGQPILMVITIAYIIQASTGASVPLLTATGHEREMLKIASVSIIAGILTSAVSIPMLGGIGTACGVVASMSVLNIGTWMACRRILGIDTFFLPIPFRNDRA